MSKTSASASGSPRPAAGRRSGSHEQLAVADVAVRYFVRADAGADEFSRLLCRHRFTEIPALPDLAAEANDGFVGTLVLDALDANRNLSAAARAVTARTIAEFSRLALISVTKLRSILMISNGSERRWDSDEKPVPKSSSASRMPWFLRLVAIVRASSISANRELSVTSTTSRFAGKPVSARIRTIRWASQPSASCDGEMLTEILIFGIPARRLAQCQADHLLGQAADQPDLFSDRNEDVGADLAGKRMDPARENFEPDDVAGRQGRPAVRNKERTARARGYGGFPARSRHGQSARVPCLHRTRRGERPGRCAHDPSQCRPGAGRRECAHRQLAPTQFLRTRRPG